MSTRGRIGILLEDGTIRSVYSHWNNQPEANGAILVKEYTTKEKVEDLIDGGDISCLKTDTDWKGNCREGTFVLYYKERGDLDCDALISENDPDYFHLTRNCDGEFAYLFDPKSNVWGCFDMHSAVLIPIYPDGM
jgi:hypothetical protein